MGLFCGVNEHVVTCTRNRRPEHVSGCRLQPPERGKYAERPTSCHGLDRMQADGGSSICAVDRRFRGCVVIRGRDDVRRYRLGPWSGSLSSYYWSSEQTFGCSRFEPSRRCCCGFEEDCRIPALRADAPKQPRALVAAISGSQTLVVETAPRRPCEER